jgi:hypothetical protein
MGLEIFPESLKKVKLDFMNSYQLTDSDILMEELAKYISFRFPYIMDAHDELLLSTLPFYTPQQEELLILQLILSKIL